MKKFPEVINLREKNGLGTWENLEGGNEKGRLCLYFHLKMFIELRTKTLSPSKSKN